jgi:thiol-disulfide isomerase/thioredoxin
MTRKRPGWLALAPAVLTSGVAGFVWYQAARGAFRGAMSFPLLFAGATTVLLVVALFGVKKAERIRFAAPMCVAVALAWGAAWSHHRYFTSERQRAETMRASTWVGPLVRSIPYAWATNVGERPASRGELDLDAPTVLVNVWATWCGPCVAEMPLLERFWQEHRDRGVRVVGVTRLYQGADDDEGRAREIEEIGTFVRERGVSYPILVVDDETYDRFGAKNLPTSLWIQNGSVRESRVSITGTEFLLASIKAELAVR